MDVETEGRYTQKEIPTLRRETTAEPLISIIADVSFASKMGTTE